MALLYALASFASALLLFLLQPLVGRMVLPAFGGSPQVWTTSMLFFQAALLAGYGYTHLLTTYLRPSRQFRVHLLLALLPLLFLPIQLDVLPSGRGGLTPSFELLGAYVTGVAAPFVLVATSGPLVQRWFSYTDHTSARDPYFLFAAGNVGSFAGLVTYPLLLEPLLPVPSQSVVWSLGYLGVVVLIATCAFLTSRRMSPSFRAMRQRETPDRGGDGPAPCVRAKPALSARRALWWVVLAFVPSSLMLGVTTHISTDIAAVPLLWVLPLGLYLLTFTIAFSRMGPSALRGAKVLGPPVVLAALIVDSRLFGMMPAILIQLVLVVLGGLIGHGLLARDRPATSLLTRFYLLVAVGGALGGVVNGIVAPALFPMVLEHGLAAASVLLLYAIWQSATGEGGSKPRQLTIVGGLILAPIVLAIGYLFTRERLPLGFWPLVAILVLATALLVTPAARRGVVALAVAAVAVMPQLQLVTDAELVQRTFFGVHRVTIEDDRFTLWHGTTVHGVQDRSSEVDELRPLAYYAPGGPMGDLMRAHREGHLGVIGLGTGGLSAYGQSGQAITFHEIDPAVIEIADTWFTYLDRTRADVNLVVGDGRLTLQAIDEPYDWLIADAFASDSIPMHLITVEAVEAYLDAVVEEGSVVLNISNRYLDLEPVLLGTSMELDIPALTKTGFGVDTVMSTWVILSHDASKLDELRDQGWRELEGEPIVWTDQRSSLIRALRW